MKAQNSFSMLRKALTSNAVFSLLSGLALALFSAPVAEVMGIGPPTIYRLVGIGLVVFGLAIITLLSRSEMLPFRALLISLADLGWVLATIFLLILAWSQLSLVGIVALTAVGLLVLVFALFQISGIYRGYLSDSERAEYLVTVTVMAQAEPAAMWATIRDLGAIHEYSEGILGSHLRDQDSPGVGAVRVCSNRAGDQWAEECVLLDDEEYELELRFLHEEPGFPFPFERLSGGWSIRFIPGGSSVRIWWAPVLSRRWIAPFLLPIMHKQVHASMTELVQNMDRASAEIAASASVGSGVSSASPLVKPPITLHQEVDQGTHRR